MVRSLIINLLCIILFSSITAAIPFDVYPEKDIVNLFPNEYQVRSLKIYNYGNLPLLIEANSPLFTKPQYLEIKPGSSEELKYRVSSLFGIPNATYFISLRIQSGVDVRNYQYQIQIRTVTIKKIGDRCNTNSDCETNNCVLKEDLNRYCAAPNKKADYLHLGGTDKIDISSSLLYSIGGITLLTIFVLFFLYIVHREKRLNRVLKLVEGKLK